MVFPYTIPYKGYDIKIFKNGLDYVLTVFKNNIQLGFTFPVSDFQLDDLESMGYDSVEMFETFIEICKGYIDNLTARKDKASK